MWGGGAEGWIVSKRDYDIPRRFPHPSHPLPPLSVHSPQENERQATCVCGIGTKCCRVLQSVAECCIVLQRVAVRRMGTKQFKQARAVTCMAQHTASHFRTTLHHTASHWRTSDSTHACARDCMKTSLCAACNTLLHTATCCTCIARISVRGMK